MKNKKIKSQFFKILFIVLFAVFITIFVSNKYGYYEYKKHEKVTLTEEQIKKFEQDIKDGKNIDLQNYVVNDANYQTNFSQIGLNISNSIANTIKKGVDSLFGYMGNLMEN